MFVINQESSSNEMSPEFLMEELSNLRGIKSSKFAQDSFKILIEKGILPKITNHEWARLCVAYYLNKADRHAAFNYAPDTMGMEILSLRTCFQEDWRFWLALIAQQILTENTTKKANIEISEVAKRINAYWHLGAELLMTRFNQLSGAYDNRHELRQHWLSELAKLVRQGIKPITPPPAAPDLTSPELEIALQNIRVNAKEIHAPIHGVRYDRFLIEFNSANDANGFTSELDNLRSELAASEDKLMSEPCTDGVHRNSVFLKILRDKSKWDTLDAARFTQDLGSIPKNMILPMCVGTDELGAVVFEDLVSAPHVFVGGTTGSGKSVCVHAMIQSVVAHCANTRAQIALFDPKQVEFAKYRGHSHLWQNQIFTDNEAIAQGIAKLVEEMDARYQQMAQLNVANIKEFPEHERPHYIIVVVDELANLIVKNKTIEQDIVNLAQKARAAGIHMILATQSPDSATFTVQLRANIDARIALKVQRGSQSSIILDETGAERLAGMGDRLVKWGGHTALRHGYHLT